MEIALIAIAVVMLMILGIVTHTANMVKEVRHLIVVLSKLCTILTGELTGIGEAIRQEDE